MSCHFRSGQHHFLAFSTKCMSLYKTAFSAGHHVLRFSHWADHFLALFSKAHQFVQNSIFSPRSGRFVILAQGHHFLAFTPKCTPLYKTAFSERDQHVLSVWHWVHHFLAISCKVREFVRNSVFSPS